MSPKMTTMVLNTVDLQCCSCYKKVKKVLCKFPEIRDQVYDEKNSKVTIKVLCCDPEMIRDKLCCKGRKVIKSIQIVDDAPTTKVPEEKQSEKSKEPEKKESGKSKEPEKSKAPDKPNEDVLKDPATKEPEPVPVCGPVHGFPRMPMYPSGACCGNCAQGYGGGPCYQGYGRPVPPPPRGPCYDYGRRVAPPPGPCYDYGYGYRGSKCCVSTDYFSEENPQGCTIM